ncbi:MAG TPA: methyltransferase domain-containing protein [Candidatus Latescibacteria bacterium]|nr:methyltransferase domain-containing protein [Candidatus Latescibacterota bacterium]
MSAPWYEQFFGHDYARFDRHPDTGREIAFLDQVLPEPPARVLDLACGTGRHAAPLSRGGYDVVGLDLSPVLLSRARRRPSTVRWLRADMSRIPLRNGSCDAVISLFSSIGYFDDESDNYRVLSEAARVLREGGRFVIETVNRDFFLRHAPPQSWFRQGSLTVLEERRLDPLTSRSEVDVIVLEHGKERSYHHSIRLYTAAELATLLASVGVEVLDVFGDYDGAALSFDTPRMVVVGEKR